MFDPGPGETTSTNWLNKIEQLGEMYNWNYISKSYCLESKLAGLAKVWYNSVSDNDKT